MTNKPQITYKLCSQREEINFIAEEGLKHHLWENDGFMLAYAEPEIIITASIAAKNKKILGVGLYLKYSDTHFCNLGVFVKPQYRRQGIGKNLINMLLPHVKDPNITIYTKDYRKDFFANFGELNPTDFNRSFSTLVQCP